MASSVQLRLMSDLKAIRNEPNEGCSASPLSDENLFVWSATIFGPDETPWEGGLAIYDLGSGCQETWVTQAMDERGFWGLASCFLGSVFLPLSPPSTQESLANIHQHPFVDPVMSKHLAVASQRPKSCKSCKS